MVNTPAVVPGSSQSPLAARVKALETALRNANNRTLRSISITNLNNQTLFSIQPSGYVDASRNPLTSLTVRDPIAGTSILTQTPAATVNNPDGTVQATNWFWHMNDSSGNQVVATDGLSSVGLAFPYIPVLMYPLFVSEPSTQGNNYSTTAGNNNTTTGANTGNATMRGSYLNAANAMWRGRIGFVSHPVISIDGTWGDAEGSGGTSTTTYALKLNGTTIGTWTVTGSSTSLHQFNISSYITQLDVNVELYITNFAPLGGGAGTDRIACQVYGTHLRQTPSSGVYG